MRRIIGVRAFMNESDCWTVAPVETSAIAARGVSCKRWCVAVVPPPPGLAAFTVPATREPLGPAFL